MTPTGDSRPSIAVATGQEAAALAASIWPCYDAVFGDVADYATWQADLFERHASRDGYRLVTAFAGDRAVGFAWGYVGQRGQYWSDRVADALPPDVVDRWVGGHFEVVELAVLAEHRGQGLGGSLHDRLLEGVGRRCLLGTSDDPHDPAVRLYLRRGWQALGTLQPGVQVMGLARA